MASRRSSSSRTRRAAAWLGGLLVVVGILFGARLYLPTAVKNHVNGVLDNLPGYRGSVADIDIALIRGAYVIDGLVLARRDAETEVPFLKIPRADISLQWRALFRGRIVSEIHLSRPRLTWVFEDQVRPDQTDPESRDWTRALDGLVPIEINHLTVTDGRVGLLKMTADPPLDVHLDKLEVRADNLQLVRSDEQELPTPIEATAVAIGQGRARLEGRANLIRKIPDMDVELGIEGIDVTALNDLTMHYANVDFAAGRLDLYSEVAIADGYLKGYLKPLLVDAELIDQGDGFFKRLWEGTVGLFKFIFSNQGTKKLATKVPFEGNLDNVEAGAWQTFVNIVRNAWIEAFEERIDKDIDIDDARQGADDERG